MRRLLFVAVLIATLPLPIAAQELRLPNKAGSVKFAVIGDKAIHEKCGEQFWQHVVDGMRVHFQNEKFSRALTEAIDEVGKVLATHFPRTSANANELPDEIVEG